LEPWRVRTARKGCFIDGGWALDRDLAGLPSMIRVRLTPLVSLGV
jgi:hypothetical protein